MKTVMTSECDYCSMRSDDERLLKEHEKGCFYNPSTRSCATCLWSGIVNNFEELGCFIGVIPMLITEPRPNVKVQCNRWIDCDLIELTDIYKLNIDSITQIFSDDERALNDILEIKKDLRVAD